MRSCRPLVHRFSRGDVDVKCLMRNIAGHPFFTLTNGLMAHSHIGQTLAPSTRA